MPLPSTAKFDEAVPPNHGPARRGVQDRFTYFFMRKLVWKLEEHRRRLRRRATADGAAYRGPRGDTYDYASARQPRSKTAMFQIVERALLQLDGRDRALLQLRYWEEASLNDIAARLGLADRFEVRRELEQVHEKVKVLVLAEVAGAILGPEDDLGPLEAA